MTWEEAYTSLKQMYKDLMFKQGWTLNEIDQFDVHFFSEVMDTQEPEKEVYLSQIW